MGWAHSQTYFVVLFLFFSIVSGKLSPNFYDSSCPDALSIIETGIKDAISREYRIGASLLRMFFHDCFVLVNFFNNETYLFRSKNTYIASYVVVKIK